MTHADLPGLRHTQNLGAMLAPSLSRAGRCVGESLQILTFCCRERHKLGVRFPFLSFPYFLCFEGLRGLGRSHPC